MHRLDAIGESGLRETLLYARRQPLPVTADEVAGAHGIHRNVARSRLERLAEAGLLVRAFERRTGRVGPGAGRPAKTYRVAPELSAIEFPERRWEQLVGFAADALPRAGRDRRLHDVGVAFGRELALQASLRPVRSLRGAVRRVCGALGTLGYQAAVVEADAAQALISTATCPLRPLVRARPDLAGLDRGMWSGLLGCALAGAEARVVTCDTRRCHAGDADCHVLVAAGASRVS